MKQKRGAAGPHTKGYNLFTVYHNITWGTTINMNGEKNKQHGHRDKGKNDMEEKLLEVSMVAARLSLDSSTIRRMYHKGILKGFLTGSELKTIRIYESSVVQHINGHAECNNTGGRYV